MQLNSVKQIWILDSFDTTPLGVLDNEGSSANAYEAVEHSQLNGYSTLDLSVYAELGAHEFIIEENKLLYQDPYGNWKLYNIKRVSTTHTGDGNLVIQAYAEEASTELIDSISPVYLQAGEKLTAEQIMQRSLVGTRWQIGDVPLTTAQEVANTFQNNTSMEMLVYGATLFGLDLVFEYEVVGNTVTSYIVNYVKPSGFTGKRFTYGLDVEEVKRTSDTTSLATAVMPFGGNLNAEVEGAVVQYRTLDGVEMLPNTAYTCTPPTEVGEPFTWTTPANFRVSGYLVYDALSQAAWGYNDGNNFRQIKYTNDKVLDAYYLAYLSWAYLQTYTSPRITYEVAAYNLGALAWYDDSVNYLRVELGDTVAVIDQVIGLEVYTRVIQVDLDLNNVANSEFTFGMLYQTLADLYLDTNSIQQQIGGIQGSIDNIQGEIDKLPDQLNTFNYIRNGRFDDGLAYWDSDNLVNTVNQTNVYGPLDAFPINQEDDPIISTTDYPIYAFGEWTLSANNNYTTQQQYSNDLPGSFLNLNFSGTNISVLATKNSSSGQVEIYLDGTLKQTVDLYSASNLYKQVIYSVTGLTDAPHVVSLVLLASSNSSSTGTNFNFDSFKVNYSVTYPVERVNLPNELGNFFVDGDVIFTNAIKVTGSSSTTYRQIYQFVNNPNAYYARTITFSAYFNYTNLVGNLQLQLRVDYTDTSNTSQTVYYHQAVPTGSSNGWQRYTLTQTIFPANLGTITRLSTAIVWNTGSSVSVSYVTGLQLELGSAVSTWKPYESDLIGSGVWDRIQAVKQQAFRELLGYAYISESNGIWVYDSPTGAGKAVALKGGTIGLGKFDPYSQSWDFKTFVDGQSVNADAINTGQMLADRIYGGVLRLGNIQGRAGYLEIVGSDGTPLVVLSADQSQYAQNRLLANFVFGVDPTGKSPIWYGKPPQNIIGRTTEDITPNQINTSSVAYYVSCSGNDDNTGTSYTTALRTVNEAIRRLPEYLDRSVNVYVARGLNYESYEMKGFLGGSSSADQGGVQINVKGQIPPKTRFIKIWIYPNADGTTYNNNINSGVYLYEIQAFEKRTGNNVAQGKSVTLESGTLASTSAAVSTLTDGITYYSDASNYVSIFGPSTASGPIVLLVDLAQDYELTGVKVYFWWQQGAPPRQYRNIVIQGNSSDSNNLYTIVDQRESALGTSFYMPTAYADQYGYYYPTIPLITGNTKCANNSILCGAHDLEFRTVNTNPPYFVYECFLGRCYGCIFDAGRTSTIAFSSNFSKLYIDGCEGSNATETGFSFFNCNTTAFSSIGAGTGLTYKYGYSVNAGTLHGNSQTPVASTLVGNIQGSFIGISSFTGKKGTVCDTSNVVGVAPPPPPIQQVTTTQVFTSTGSNQGVKSDSGNTWSWFNSESYPAQGTWGYGLRSGYWWFGNQIYDLVNSGAKINWIKFTFTRNNTTNGLASAATAQIRTHNFAAKPSVPGVSTSDPTITASLTRGQTVTVTLSADMVAKFNAKAARGIYLYTTSTSQSYYMKCGTSAKLEVNYTK